METESKKRDHRIYRGVTTLKEIENRCSVDAAILDSAKNKYERGTKFMEKMITRKEAAKMLGISINALDEARSTGMIFYIQYVENGCVYCLYTGVKTLAF